MNKQQEKQYKEYCQTVPVNEEPLTSEEWLEAIKTAEEQEKEEYLNYQKKVSENNALPEGKEPQKILNKEEWIKAGKPTGESKHEKFIRLAEKRTEKALAVIDTIFNLKSPVYDSSIEERKQIIQVLNEKIKKLETHFAGQKEISTGFKIQPVKVEPILSA